MLICLCSRAGAQDHNCFEASEGTLLYKDGKPYGYVRPSKTFGFYQMSNGWLFTHNPYDESVFAVRATDVHLLFSYNPPYGPGENDIVEKYTPPPQANPNSPLAPVESSAAPETPSPTPQPISTPTPRSSETPIIAAPSSDYGQWSSIVHSIIQISCIAIALSLAQWLLRHREKGEAVPGTEYQCTIIILLLFAIIGVWPFSHFKPISKWEYKIVSPSDAIFDTQVNKMGQEGWEIVSARRATSGFTTGYELICKRPKH